MRMSSPELRDMIFDWEQSPLPCPDILDVTLRDGLQGIFPRYPTLAERLRLVDFLLDLGITGFEIGFPAAGDLHSEQTTAIARHIEHYSPGARIVCLARTREDDVTLVAELAGQLGRQIGVGIFVGASGLRRFVEGWTVADLSRWVKTSVKFAVAQNLEVTFVCEDATRTEPRILQTLYDAALDAGATRLAIPDTVGVCTPESTANIVGFVREVIVGDQPISIEWHGHNDRALGVANALAAAQAGAGCVHTTVLGTGERCGNVPLEPLLVASGECAMARYRMNMLAEIAHYTASILGMRAPAGYPVIGAGAYATAAGTHAAAIVKAEQMDRPELAALAYAGIDPAAVGAAYDIVVGPFSGRANVVWRAARLGITVTEADINAILQTARREERVLDDDEVRKIVTNRYAR